MLDVDCPLVAAWPCSWPQTVGRARSRLLSGKELLKWYETGHLNFLHRGLSIARINAYSIAHRARAALAAKENTGLG